MGPPIAVLLAFAFATIAVLAPARCAAQIDDTSPFDSAYAAAFGAGEYRLADGTEAQTLRGNFSVELREPSQDRAGLRVLLPAALGLQDSANDELPAGRPTDRIEHIGVLPGVEFEHLVRERLTFKTRAQLGRAWELEGIGQSATVAAAGFRTQLAFDDAPGRPALITGVRWAGFDSDAGERRSLLRVTAGVELDFPAMSWRVRGQPMRWWPHVLKNWYYDPPPAFALGDGGVERRAEEWQLGVAAAREGGFQLWFLEFEAVGLAYRFSDLSEGLAIYLNSVF